jgi:acyl dehydratase
MSTTTARFNADQIGVTGDPFPFRVDRERIVAYAAATNDPIAEHRNGDLAPPVFAVVPAMGVLAEATTRVIPGELLMMVLHGEQDFHYHRAIRPGMDLETRATPVGLHPRSSGVTVTVRGETRDANGDLLVEQFMTSFVRGAKADEPVGEQPPLHAFDAALRERPPDAEVVQTFDEDQTFRYSEAAGDPMPIHLDDELAKAMGLPGIIIHGLCTMAFTSVAVIQHACPGDPTRLKRLAVRFAQVVQPKQTITTRIWSEDAGRYAFETDSDAGATVIKDGLAALLDE